MQQEQKRIEESAIGNFFEFVLGDTVQEFTEGFLTNQAQKQVGDLLANEPDLASAYRSGDEAARARIANLNPKAQNLYEKFQAQATANDYINEIATQLTASPVLRDPHRTDEERAAEKARIKGAAAASTGLSAMQPYWLTQFAGSLENVESQVERQTMDRLAKARKELGDIKVGDSLAVTAIENADAVMVGNAMELDENKLAQQTSAGREQLRQNIIETTGSEVGGAPILTAKEHYQANVDGTTRAVERLIGEDKFDEAERLIDWSRGLAVSPLKLKGGLDYFSQTTRNGVGWSQTMNALETRVESARRRSLIKTKDEVLAEMIGNLEIDGADMKEVAKRYMREHPELASEIMSTASQYSAFDQAPTPAQNMAQFEVLQKIKAPGMSIVEANKLIAEAVAAEEITVKQGMGLMGKVTSQTEGLVNDYVQNAKKQIGENGHVKSKIAHLWEQEYKATHNLSDNLDADQAEKMQDAYKNQKEIYKGVILQEIEDRVQKRIEEQEIPMTVEQLGKVFAEEADIYLNEQAQLISKRRGKQAEPSISAPTMRQEIEKELEYIRSQKSKGIKGIEQFSKKIQDLVIQQGIKPEELNTEKAFAKAERIMLQAMQNLPEEQKFEDPRSSYQDLTDPDKEQQASAPSSPGAGLFQGNPIARAVQNYKKARPLYEVVEDDVMPAVGEWWQRALPKPGPPSLIGLTQIFGAGGQKEGDQSSLPNPQEIMSRSLAALAQVPTALMGGSANAATRNDDVLIDQPEEVERLAKIWTRRERLKINTPVLPQVKGGAITKVVPVAIKSDRHPYFLAIGLNEGTRTAAGGYTRNYQGHYDRGDDHRNRGTVSGGRGATRGMSAQQVDRYYMRELTNYALMMAPKLRAMGLKPNTQVWHRTMFNFLDLHVQSPLAAQGFAKLIPMAIAKGGRIEAFAQIRAESFRNPTTGRLEISKAFSSYSDLLRDQRSRAGTFDYKARL